MLRRLPLLLFCLTLTALAFAPAAEASSATRTLQARLAGLGYLRSEMVDGEAGPATAQATMAFQGWAGLSRDGVAGPRTRAALRTATRPRPWSDLSGRRAEIHIGRQVLLLVDARGRTVQAIHISSAGPGHYTPHGSYRVQRKYLRDWSRPFHTWLPLASYFTGGYALHEYASVPGYPASHGCVRVPAWASYEVYGFATVGTPVIVRD
jgi:N-acetylmuramoyl-L-alanine amidase